jgi:hypothetical protein
MEPVGRPAAPGSLPVGFFTRMARAGALAPSGDNLQPWSFAVDGDTLLVHHDPTRDRSIFNVQALASYIALGAVLENVSIAAADDGYRAKFDYFPLGTKATLTAAISFEAGAQPDPLTAFLEKRCTNRRSYDGKPVSPELLQTLDGTDGTPAVNLNWLYDSSRLQELGVLLAQADRVIFENKHIHHHLFSTLRWTATEVEKMRDGLPIASLELGKLGSVAFRAVSYWSLVNFLNRFGFSRAASSHTSVLMKRCSAAGLVTLPEISPTRFLEAGRAFQRTWLSATQRGLSLQPMTAIIFFQLRSRLADYEGLSAAQCRLADELTQQLKDLFALSTEQIPAMLFRVGFSSPPSAGTLRRPTI